MDTIRVPEEIDLHRRRFFGAAASPIAAAAFDATFDRSVAALDNADHVAIVIHNYRRRLGLAESKYAHRIITGGVGHNLPQEAPQAFADAVIDVATV